MFKRRYRGWWAGLLALVSISVPFIAESDTPESPRRQALKQLMAGVKAIGTDRAADPASGERTRYTRTEDGSIRFLGTPAGFHFTGFQVVPGRPDESARAFLQANRGLFGISSSRVEFGTARIRETAGRQYVRLQQTYGGVPVVVGEVLAQIDAEGGVASITSDIMRNTRRLDDGSVSLAPAISPQGAIDAARTYSQARAPGATVETSAATLKIWAPEVLDLPGEVRLVWETRVTSEDHPEVNADVFIDAHSGTFVHAFSRFHTALDREIYDANNTTTLPGTLERDEGDPPSAIGDVNGAYQFLGDTYNFYANQHGRDGLDDSGSTLLATTRWCKPMVACPWGNAAWDGTRMKFGQGYTIDDVTGHELTHGVTENESGLVYENTSGAINESFSDMWGEWIDQTNGAGTDNDMVKWLMGEDLPGGAIRDMSDPPVYGDPDRLSSPNYVAPVGTPDDSNDQGGVHTNSGIPNKLCFLLTDGEDFNGRTIHGMGISPVANLFYEVQVNLLGSGPDWTDFANATLQAAINLDWNDAEFQNLVCALAAVELIEDAAPPMATLDDNYSTFDPPNPWTQEGIVITTLTVTTDENTFLRNVRFIGEPFQCFDVPCETGDIKRIPGENIEFVPPYIDYLPAGETVEIEVKHTIPIGRAACIYAGHVTVAADVDGLCSPQVATTVEDTVEVTPVADLDIDDNHGSVSDNVLHLKGAKNTSVTGTFTVVNPNSEVKNVDLDDGPGNIGIEPVAVNVTNLVKIGDPAVVIPSDAISVQALPDLSMGEARDLTLTIDVPDGIPVNAFYAGSVTVYYEGCDGGGSDQDTFNVLLEVLPTQGTLDIVETSIDGDFCPDDPWTQIGHVQLSFDVHAIGDHRNIRVMSGGLLHNEIETKLDDFNFFPQEIAYLAAGETRHVVVIVKIPIGQNAGHYFGQFRVVSENGGEDSVDASIDICPIFDMDIKDNYGNLSGNVMVIQATSRANHSGGEWSLRAFDVGLSHDLVSNLDEFDGPGNAPVDCITCRFAPWSKVWHENTQEFQYNVNMNFLGEGSVMGDSCDWRSGEYRRMLVGLYVPPMVGGNNQPGTYKGRLDCWAVAASETVSYDGFDIEVKLARIVGNENTNDKGTFGVVPTEYGAEVYWGEFTSIGLAGSVNLYRQGPGDESFKKVNQAPLPQRSSYRDTDVGPGEVAAYKLGVVHEGRETVLGPLSVGGIPREPRLAQNAPNPFADQTVVAYDLPVRGPVSLRIYDLSGRLVRTLKNQVEEAGFYSVPWNRKNESGRKAASGIYFYRLETPGFSATKKMIVIQP